jgi:tRNA A-37 threonylcarbamoyl transferase component Bud32
MEFDLGETSLYNYIRKRPHTTLKELLCDSMKIIYQLLQSLAGMHTHGIVHRDLKSSNVVMLNDKAWIIDLGMSKR